MEYRRQVAMRCDGEDFVIALQPEDEVVFRTKDARALRNLCRRLRWQIAIDTTLCFDAGNAVLIAPMRGNVDFARVSIASGGFTAKYGLMQDRGFPAPQGPP